VTKRIQRMREELVRRKFAESTMRAYLQVAEDFRRYLHDVAGAAGIRSKLSDPARTPPLCASDYDSAARGGPTHRL